MKRTVIPWFFILTVLIAAFSVFAFAGSSWLPGSPDYIRGIKDIIWEHDSGGGMSITFSAVSSDEASQDSAKRSADIIRNRMKIFDIASASVDYDEKEKKVFVDLAWVEGAEGILPETVMTELGRPADVMFIMGTPQSPDNMTDSDQFLLGGGNILSADIEPIPDSTQNLITVRLNGAGVQAAENLKADFSDKTVTVWMDDECVCTAAADELFDDEGNVRLCADGGGYSADDADRIAIYISNGVLPLELEAQSFEYTSPRSENVSEKVMLWAGGISLVIICLFMILYYRLPGMVACVSMIGQAAGIIACVTGFLNFGFIKGVKMSVPGVVGIIMCIGIGYYTNVIINERIIEEIKKGKSLNGAIEAGCSHSIISAFDGNITAVLAGLIIMGLSENSGRVTTWLMKPFVWMFPSVSIESLYALGFVLVVGSLLNIVFGMLATRPMLKSLSGYSVFHNRWLFGGQRSRKEGVK